MTDKKTNERAREQIKGTGLYLNSLTSIQKKPSKNMAGVGGSGIIIIKKDVNCG